MVDEPDDMEAVGHDAGIGKVLAYQGPIAAGQVHTHHPHPALAFQAYQIVLQGSLAAAQHDIVDRMVPQVAQGGGIALAAVKEVLVDAQHHWAHGPTALSSTQP